MGEARLEVEDVEAKLERMVVLLQQALEETITAKVEAGRLANGMAEINHKAVQKVAKAKVLASRAA